MHRNLNFNVGGFCNLVDNRITTGWSQALQGQVYTNISRVNIAGLDANVSWRHALGFGVRASYMYTHEHVRKGEPYTSSTRPHTATVRLDYGREWRNYGFKLSLSGRVLSSVTVDEYTSVSNYEDIERVTYPAYTMWRLNLTQNVWKGINVTLAVDNLFNYVPKYYYSNSPTTNGTTVSAGVSVDIERFFSR